MVLDIRGFTLPQTSIASLHDPMSDDGGSSIKHTAEAVAAIVKEVPFYHDAVEPAAKEIGSSLLVIAQTIKVLLTPLRALVWGYEQIEEWLLSDVAAKVKAVPPKRLLTPATEVAVPIVEAMRYTAHRKELRDMYANLLGSAIDRETAATAHPGFVEIVKQITPDEARILRAFTECDAWPSITVRATEVGPPTGEVDIYRNFSLLGEQASCEHPELTPVYINNLCRLAVIEIPSLRHLTSPGVYDSLQNHPHIQMLVEQIAASGRTSRIVKSLVQLTPFGQQFCLACVIGVHPPGKPGPSSEVEAP